MATPLPKHSNANFDPSARSLAKSWGAVRASNIPSWRQFEAMLADPPAFAPVELWLVRHGETTTNARGLVTGTSDAPLTPAGHRQAHEAGLMLAEQKFDIAWSSTLRRAKDT